MVDWRAREGGDMRKVKTAALFSSILILIVVVMASAPAAMAQTTPGSDIHLVCGPAYWESYADYTQGLLTVDYSIGNTGTGPAYNTTLTQASANSGVTGDSILPIWVGDQYVGEWNDVKLRWNVPKDVSVFRTTLTICNDCRPDICGDGTNGGLDIKPGSCPNPINIGQGNAQVAVAVFSYGDFDARTLDDSTVVFAGASPVNVAEEDKNGDGVLDMLYHFSRNDMNLQVGDTRACLSASIEGGGTYEACDMVVVQ